VKVTLSLIEHDNAADNLPINHNFVTVVFLYFRQHIFNRVVSGWTADLDARVNQRIVVKSGNLALDQRFGIGSGGTLNRNIHSGVPFVNHITSSGLQI
jgi:hypothetical protein